MAEEKDTKRKRTGESKAAGSKPPAKSEAKPKAKSTKSAGTKAAATKSTAGSTAAGSKPKSETKAKPKTEAKAKTEAKPKSETKAKPTSTKSAATKTAAESKAKPKSETKAKPKTEAKPKAQPQRPVVNARARYVRVAPRKARLVADQVRGLHVDDARTLLRFSTRGAARDIAKLIDSATANAEANHDLVADDLRVTDIRVDEGPTLRRYRPRALGRATRINKRTSHIRVALTPED